MSSCVLGHLNPTESAWFASALENGSLRKYKDRGTACVITESSPSIGPGSERVKVATCFRLPATNWTTPVHLKVFSQHNRSRMPSRYHWTKSKFDTRRNMDQPRTAVTSRAALVLISQARRSAICSPALVWLSLRIPVKHLSWGLYSSRNRYYPDDLNETSFTVMRVF